MIQRFSILTVCLVFLSINLIAQETDSLLTKQYKNTIRWNLTPALIIGPKSIVLGYERVVNNHQTFSINIGYLEKKPSTNKDGEPLNLFDESINCILI